MCDRCLLFQKGKIGRMEQVLYQTIACNIRERRKQLCYSQAKLAEKAEVSVDTIKSIESGRRTMNLDTYLRIVEALETTPVGLIKDSAPEEWVDRLLFMTANFSSREMKFVLHMVEQLLKGYEDYLK